MRDILEKLTKPFDDIDVKGKATPYCAINGNMFAFVEPDGSLCFRYSEDRKAEFNQQHGTADVVQYGAVMRGYVRMPDQIMSDEAALHEHFAQSLTYARSLKPKATKKR